MCNTTNRPYPHLLPLWWGFGCQGLRSSTYQFLTADGNVAQINERTTFMPHQRNSHRESKEGRKKGFGVHSSWNIKRRAWDFNNITHSLFPLCTLSRSSQQHSLVNSNMLPNYRVLNPVIPATAIRQALQQSAGVKKEITERTNSYLLYWKKWGKFQVMVFFTIVYEHGHVCPHFLLFTLVLAFRHFIFP